MSQESSILTETARLVVQEDYDALKIAIVPDDRVAGLLAQVLVRSFRIPKKDIVQLGYTASDEQNKALLRGRRHIVIAPQDILHHRPCTFDPPVGSNQVSLIDATREPIEVRRIGCGDGPFELVRSSSNLTHNAALLNEAVDRLASLYKAHPEGFLKESPERSEVRRIGETLSDVGGMPLMQTAHARFVNRCNVQGAARNLELVWHGIGAWLE